MDLDRGSPGAGEGLVLQLGVLRGVEAEGGVLLVADSEGGDSALEHARHLVQARHARRVYCDLLLSSGRRIINPLLRAANGPSVFTIMEKAPTFKALLLSPRTPS